MPDGDGGFADVRENVDGHPMVNLLAYARPYWPRLSVGVAASVLTRFARLVPPIVVATAIDRILRGSGEPGLLAKAGLLPAGEISGQAARLALLEQLVLIAVLAYLLRSVTRFVSRYLLQSTAQKIQRDLRDDTYDHLQHLEMDFFENHQTGGMMSILNSDINRLEQFLNTEFRQIIRVVATVGGIAVVLWTYSPTLALVALAPVPVIGVASGGFLSYIEPRYQSIRETVARLNTRLENNLGGAAVIKTFDRHGFERGRVAEHSQAYHDEKVAALRIRRAFFAGLRLVTGAVFVLVLWVGGRGIVTGAAGAISVGAFAAFFLYLRRLYSPMRRVGKSANKYQLAKSSAERVFGLLGREPRVTTPADPYRPEAVAGDVTFDSVTFGYEEREPVLRDVSLDVPAGATVGLAGATGAGKSTLLKLLPRFYDVCERDVSRASQNSSSSGDVSEPRSEAQSDADASDAVDSGEVLVDGVDVREWDLGALRDEIAVVEQTPYLFAGTVAENVAYGDADVLADEWAGSHESRERIVEAAKAAAAHEFVSDLPDGYDTLVGERGVKLSGGQRQRVAIARALLNDPSIIVFDEATSDVDTETEELIQESVDQLVAERTAFVIAHRLSTIKDADRIVVMEDGEIVESGTHAELLREAGDYAALWEAQADEGTARASADD